MTTVANGFYGHKVSELNKACENIDKKQTFCHFFFHFIFQFSAV